MEKVLPLSNGDGLTVLADGSTTRRDLSARFADSISLKDYATGDGATNDTAAIALWKAACDAAGVEGVVPGGTYIITADVELPNKVRCYGTFSGAYFVLYQRRQNGYVHGLKADKVKLRGLYFCDVSSLEAPVVVVDGYDNSWGTFWCTFRQWRVDVSCTVDITNWSVNANIWTGGRIGYFNLTGNVSLYAGSEAHGNTLDSVDFTSPSGPNRGVLQDDIKRQVNFIRSCYYEAASDIVGNFHIWGNHGDLSSPVHTDRFTHMMGATGVNQLNSKDFLSLGVKNLCRGGSWDWLDTDGKPVGVVQNNGASVSVQTDTTEPCGIGKRYQADFADAFDNFSVAIQPSGVDRFGVVIFYKSSSDFVAIESNDGSGAVSHSVTAVTIDSVNNWKMLRLSGPASKTATTAVTLFAYAGSGGATKTMSIGGVFAASERAVLFPTKNDEYRSQIYASGTVHDVGGVRTQAGSVSQGYVASPTTVDVAVTFHEAFSSTTGLSVTSHIEANGAPSANASKIQVKSGTLTTAGCTLTVTYAVGFQGVIHWQAIGRR